MAEKLTRGEKLTVWIAIISAALAALLSIPANVTSNLISSALSGLPTQKLPTESFKPAAEGDHAASNKIISETSPRETDRSRSDPATLPAADADADALPVSPSNAQPETTQLSEVPAATSIAKARPVTDLLVSPRSSPLSATVEPISFAGGDRVSIRMHFTSQQDDLIFFVTEHGDLDGWAASVEGGSVPCVGGGNEFFGLKKTREDSWTREISQLTRLPRGVPITISGQFICRGQPVEGRRLSATMKFYVSDGVRAQPITLFMPDQIAH